eukprot:TRINITY_DN21416_c0_g1_i7.p1 TRINITY_DN21416_c0_g1~~TRINITY_DN21416_c0_g1_i7.p1  ORF type:complete len:324 (-),score=31.36 TRINITY_DN21416_c0_g1_i7:23-994(-)
MMLVHRVGVATLLFLSRFSHTWAATTGFDPSTAKAADHAMLQTIHCLAEERGIMWPMVRSRLWQHFGDPSADAAALRKSSAADANVIFQELEALGLFPAAEMQKLRSGTFSSVCTLGQLSLEVLYCCAVEATAAGCDDQSFRERTRTILGFPAAQHLNLSHILTSGWPVHTLYDFWLLKSGSVSVSASSTTSSGAVQAKIQESADSDSEAVGLGRIPRSLQILLASDPCRPPFPAGFCSHKLVSSSTHSADAYAAIAASALGSASKKLRRTPLAQRTGLFHRGSERSHPPPPTHPLTSLRAGNSKRPLRPRHGNVAFRRPTKS